ncbi:uncharacterized protein BJ171DRAFT_522892 [Polychytrium aggregatum]|uniref:uncharacterized protein n=1 Tax=Polychytrium aggregatum TaxID=110093 RepID=UPI0022FE69BA|nr:uncharacterized protein BJ171DRAFT_522892 [Polychytrium aggregatum]KAI9197157.1 hypothetical protein BJ171DRAFT_522892 [Polychytrium aggregatum]
MCIQTRLTSSSCPQLSSSCASTLHLRSEHGPVALAVTGFGTLEEHDTILHKHPHALQRYVYAPFCEEQTPARLVKPRILSRHHDLVDFDGQMYSWETGLWGAMKLRNVNTRECIAVVQTLGTKAFSGASGNIHITAAGFHMVDLIVSSAMTVALDEMLVWADA